MVEAMTPTHMAPEPLTKPAQGVMATSPTIIPLTDPRNVGFLAGPRNMSQTTQVSRATAVARLVLITAVAASALEKYGSPPLKPFQPSHRMPAPIATMVRLCGTNLARSRASRGPITHAATKPLVPAARWMT